MTGKSFEDGDMERRVQFLEKGFDKIDGKLDRVLDTLVAFRRETDLRFGDIEKRMEARFGDLEKRMEARFGEIETRMEARFSAIEVRFGEIETRMEARFSAVEIRFGEVEKRIEVRFNGVDSSLARIDATLDNKASAADVAELRGMVRALPTTMHMITLVFGILAGAFAIIRFGLPHP